LYLSQIQVAEREKLMQKHKFLPSFGIGDCGLDKKKNFSRIRSSCSIPTIDYNKRRKKTDLKSLRKRDYDGYIWPYGKLARFRIRVFL